MTNKPFIEGIDYYLREGRVVFTAKYLTERGYCCGSGCTHCPYIPRHTKDNKNLQDESDTENTCNMLEDSE
jgi:hypothetical protein